MSADKYIVGDLIRVWVEIRTIAGDLVDPTSIALYVKPPGGVISERTAIKAAVGKYYYDLSLDLSGSYGYRWQTRGENQGVSEGGVYVYPQSVV